MNKNITLELTEDQAFWLQSFCVDASISWHDLWKDATDGKRPELDAKACRRLNHKALAFAEQIRVLRSVS